MVQYIGNIRDTERIRNQETDTIVELVARELAMTSMPAVRIVHIHRSHSTSRMCASVRTTKPRSTPLVIFGGFQVMLKLLLKTLRVKF